MATTTNYSWSTPDDTALVKDGASAIRTLGSSVDSTLFTALGGAYPGLRLIKKQTIGTAVTSVTVTNAFSATYENYKIIVTGGTASATSDFYMQLTGITSGYYSQLNYGTFGSNSSPLTVSASNASVMNWVGAYNTNTKRISLDLFSPFATNQKTGKSDFMIMATNGNNGESRHWIDSTASSTGFTLTTASGTITGGTIYVYGYGAS
jgi:hypothetical protein